MELASSSLALLRRVHMWLRVLWGRGAVVVESRAASVTPAPNRSAQRLEQRSLPAARRRCELDAILYRTHGRAYYLRWIYDYGLSGRVRWCFMDWNWRWPARIFFANVDVPKLCAVCHAPLFPD